MAQRFDEFARPKLRPPVDGIHRDLLSINTLAESFFATLKTEFYYRRIWPTRARAIQGVAAWIEDHYNRRRRHSSIGHVTPVDIEMQYSSQAAEIQLAA